MSRRILALSGGLNLNPEALYFNTKKLQSDFTILDEGKTGTVRNRQPGRLYEFDGTALLKITSSNLGTLYISYLDQNNIIQNTSVTHNAGGYYEWIPSNGTKAWNIKVWTDNLATFVQKAAVLHETIPANMHSWLKADEGNGIVAYDSSGANKKWEIIGANLATFHNTTDNKYYNWANGVGFGNGLFTWKKQYSYKTTGFPYLQSFTIIACVNPRNFDTNYNEIITNGGAWLTSKDFNFNFGLRWSNSPVQDVLRPYLYMGDGTNHAGVEVDSPEGKEYFLTGAGANEYIHFAISYDDNTGQVTTYWRGAQLFQNTPTFGTPSNAGNRDLIIGWIQDVYPADTQMRGFNGEIKYVRIFDRAITLNEYQEDHNSGNFTEDYTGLSFAGNIVEDYLPANYHNGDGWADTVGSEKLTNFREIVVPRNESLVTEDVIGLPLQNSGRVPHNAKLVQGNCLNMDGTAYLQFATGALTGLSITSYEGTGTPTLDDVNDRITCTAGTLYNIVLSNGSHLPCSEGFWQNVHDVVNSLKGVLTTYNGATIWGLQDTYHYNAKNNFWGDGFVGENRNYLEMDDVNNGAATRIDFEIITTEETAPLFEFGICENGGVSNFIRGRMINGNADFLVESDVDQVTFTGVTFSKYDKIRLIVEVTGSLFKVDLYKNDIYIGQETSASTDTVFGIRFICGGGPTNGFDINFKHIVRYVKAWDDADPNNQVVTDVDFTNPENYYEIGGTWYIKNNGNSDSSGRLTAPAPDYILIEKPKKPFIPIQSNSIKLNEVDAKTGMNWHSESKIDFENGISNLPHIAGNSSYITTLANYKKGEGNWYPLTEFAYREESTEAERLFSFHNPYNYNLLEIKKANKRYGESWHTPFINIQELEVSETQQARISSNIFDLNASNVFSFVMFMDITTVLSINRFLEAYDTDGFRLIKRSGQLEGGHLNNGSTKGQLVQYVTSDYAEPLMVGFIRNTVFTVAGNADTEMALIHKNFLATGGDLVVNQDQSAPGLYKLPYVIAKDLHGLIHSILYFDGVVLDQNDVTLLYNNRTPKVLAKNKQPTKVVTADMFVHNGTEFDIIHPDDGNIGVTSGGVPLNNLKFKI